MAKKIDPINKKNYGATSTMLTVTDMNAAINFYQKAFGFTKRGVMKGPDGKPMHAELKLRDTVLMLGPECPERGARSEEGERPDDHAEDQIGVEVGDDPGRVVEAEVDGDERIDHRSDAADCPAGEADVEQRRGERPLVARAPDEHRH